MPSEQDRIADGLNKPLMTLAIIIAVVGFFLCLTIALLPLGVVLLAIGGAWAAALVYSSTARAKHVH